METKSRSNLSNMKQKELSTSHNQSMIIQHLSDENTNKNWTLALITEYRVTF